MKQSKGTTELPVIVDSRIPDQTARKKKQITAEET